MFEVEVKGIHLPVEQFHQMRNQLFLAPAIFTLKVRCWIRIGNV